MPRNIPLLCIYVLCVCLSQLNAQRTSIDYAVSYSFQWITDTSKQDYSTPEPYLLYKKGKESRFLNFHAYHNDSIHHYFSESRKGEIYSQEAVDQFFKLHQHQYKRYTSALRLAKDFKKNEATIVLYETSNRHYLREPLGLDWELIPGMDSIAGIPCSKAQTYYGGRLYTAWYAPQIPIADGPYIFHGLPGLITKVTDSDNWYTFLLQWYELPPKNAFSWPPFMSPNFQQKLDRSNYIQRSKKEKEDPRYRTHYKKVTPEILDQLREKRKTRFDLIIEKE